MWLITYVKSQVSENQHSTKLILPLKKDQIPYYIFTPFITMKMIKAKVIYLLFERNWNVIFNSNMKYP